MRLRRAALSTSMLIGPVGLGGAMFAFRHVPVELPPPPPPAAEQALSIRYLGVTGYAISDGETTIILDPMLNRATADELLLPLDPDPELAARWVPEADFVLVNHAHYDHAIDAPSIALRTGAPVLGPQSVVNLALSRGVPAPQTRALSGGERLTLGSCTVNVAASTHGSVLGMEKPMYGEIPPDAGALWFFQYKHDESLSYRIECGGASVWFHPSALYTPGELGGLEADTLIIGVNNADANDAAFRDIVADVKPRRILPSHYDNFFQPIDLGLSLFPGLDLERRRDVLIGDATDIGWVVMDYGQVLTVPPDAP